MPNPFLQANMNRGQQPPDRWNPIPEEYASQESNRPYIGSIDHGVDSPDVIYNPELDDDMNESEEAIYEVEPPEQTPIPVRIVTTETSAKELKSFRVYRSYAALSNAAQIVGRHDRRTSLRIKNLGTDRIWLGDTSSNANAFSGYPLDSGATLTLESTLEVWAVADTVATNPTPIAILADFGVAY